MKCIAGSRMKDLRRCGILNQPAFVIGLILGLSLSTLLSQALLGLEFNYAIWKRSSDGGQKGELLVEIPVKTEYKEKSTPSPEADVRSVLNLIVSDTKLPPYLMGLTVVQTDNSWKEYRKLISSTWGTDMNIKYYEQSGKCKDISGSVVMLELF